MVDVPRVGVEAAADDPPDEHLVGHVEEQEGVSLDALCGQRVRLVFFRSSRSSNGKSKTGAKENEASKLHEFEYNVDK